MKVIVLNFTKHRTGIVILSLLVSMAIILPVFIAASRLLYNQDLSAVSAHTLDYSKIIIIDAGHGGEDSGAVGVSGVLEKDLNLEYAMEVGKLLEEKGYVIVYTRTDDRLLYKEEENIYGIRKISDLKNRAKVAEEYPSSLFISIHMNSFGAAKYSGLQVYYSEKDQTSQQIANSIQNKVKDSLQPENNRVIKKGEGMYLLENVSNPAVLIECGFLTNEDECKKLSEKEYKNQLCFSIVCGIIEYMEKTNEK